MSSPLRREKKYQMLKLIHSGRTLVEAKAMMKAAEVALTDEYTSKRDKLDLLSLEGGMHRILMTRGRAVDLMKLRFAPRNNLESNREEVLAKFVTPYKGGLPLNWKRDGNLIRRGKENPPRIGSSAGKIGKTRGIGAKKVLNDFNLLIRTLQGLQQRYGKGNQAALRKAYKSVRSGIQTGFKKG